MPKRHGIKWRTDLPGAGVPEFYFGIWQAFVALPFLGFRSHIVRPPGSIDPMMMLEQHINTVIPRLLYSLDQLQMHLTAYSGEWDVVDALFNHEIPAQVAVDSTAFYLNVFIDDIAKLVPYVMDDSAEKPLDGFSQVKKLVEKKRHPTILPLFDELSQPQSWWQRGFERGIGFRQRFTHYTDILIVRPSADKVPMVHIVNAEQKPSRNFLQELREVLSGLCDWLDRLEAVVMNELKQQAANKSMTWQPSTVIHKYTVPMQGLATGKLNPFNDLLYLPLCTD